MSYEPHRRTPFQKAWDFIQDISPYFIINMVWIFFTVLLVTAIPAAAGLYYATNKLAHGRTSGLDAFFEGAKLYFGVSWKWGLPNLVIALLFVVNFWFYRDFSWEYSAYMRLIFYLLLFVWASVNLYIFPFLIEQYKPDLRTAIRNSVITFLRFPIQSIGLLLLYILLIWISSLYLPPLWIVATGTVIAYTSNKMTIYAVEKISIDGDSTEENNEKN
ncbi:MAG: hypothetical protein H8D34_26340 [Chloroflexi bacterium]|nr:hypothetical protein [Chloroflexota bacterium]